jgi:hypothetical protein
LSNRLAAARRLLAQRLTRRGVTLTGGTLALGLAHHAASAGVPATLVVTTVEAAAVVTVGGAAGAALAAPVAALAEGVLKIMFLNQLKTAAAVVLAVGVLVTGTGALTLPALRGSGGESATDKPAQTAGAPKPAENKDPQKDAPLKEIWDETYVDAVSRLFLGEVLTDADTTDAEFIRRAFLDVRGVLPTALELRLFLIDPDPDKRKKLVEWLLADPELPRRWWLHFSTKDAAGWKRKEQFLDRFQATDDASYHRRLVQRIWETHLGVAAGTRKAGDRLDQLLDELLANNRPDRQVLDALCLATMARYPTDGERQFILAYVSGQEDRRVAFGRVLDTLLHTEESRKYVDALNRRSPRR